MRLSFEWLMSEFMYQMELLMREPYEQGASIKPRLIMPANHPANPLGCKCEIMFGPCEKYYKPLEPINVMSRNDYLDYKYKGKV